MHVIPQSGAHLHILLNHFPSVGMVIALGFYAAAYRLRNDQMKRSSLVLLVILGVLSIPTYFSGAYAMLALAEVPGISQSLIDSHRDMALLTFLGLGTTGCAAWIVLWRGRHLGVLSGRGQLGVVALAIVALGLMVQTGHLGGHINHPEIRPVTAVDSSLGLSAGIEQLVGVNWVVPMQVLHFLGMSLLFGTVLVVTLRILGVVKAMSFAAVHRLLPLGLLGLLMNVVSGLILFMFDSGGYVARVGFPPKIALVVIGALAILYLSICERTWDVRAGEDAPRTSKAVAVVVFASWTGVLVYGRLLPYL